jgi:pimeloyl-ACP methyl ester carboxylesterase
MNVTRAFGALLFCAGYLLSTQPFYDRTHLSEVFGQERFYRVLLPPDYETSGKRYPVIYYLHGHSDRYTVERYDKGTDTIPKMVEFVAKNDVIVVSVDGYVAKDYTGFYGGTPWDVRIEGGDFDFGKYLLELVQHVDATYRTRTDRAGRAISGLSMGGFMSLYLSARYPELLGSVSSFNPGPEFYVGEKGRRSLWRPKDHVRTHSTTMVRLIRASGDYISQYHEETHAAYASTPEVDFEFRQDEYHRHWATSIGETFAFHMRAFANGALNNIPERWTYTSGYREFDVRGYQFRSSMAKPALVTLQDVTQGSLRVTTRRWAPDGPPAQEADIRLATAPIYKANAAYRVVDHNLTTGKTTQTSTHADKDGRLQLAFDGAGHQLSFAGPGTGAEAPILLPVSKADRLLVTPGKPVALPIRIYNPRTVEMKNVEVELTSDYPTVKIDASAKTKLPLLAAGSVADVSSSANATFTSGSGYLSRARLKLKFRYDDWQTAEQYFDVLILPDDLSEPAQVEVLDGRTKQFDVFRQSGNRGGGQTIVREVTEGKGNGNGVLEPGEEATIWVRLRQGIDPFDKNTWHRTKVYSDSPYVAEIADIQETKQLEWTGAQERTSLIRVAPETPASSSIPLVLDNESWSYHFTPDVRYGREPLYQAFQLHGRHLHRLTLKLKEQTQRSHSSREIGSKR